MKKFLSAVLSLSIMLGTCVGVVSAASLESGTASEVFGETEFYVKHDKNRVYWGGGFTATGKLSDDLYQLMIGFYDNGRLVAADRIEIDEALSSYVFKEQCIRLASEPENLTARAFAWSNNGVIPLCGAVDAKNVAFNTYYAKGRITEVDRVSKTLDFQIEYSENFESNAYDGINCVRIEASYDDDSITDYLGVLIDVEISSDGYGGYKIEAYDANVREISMFSGIKEYFSLDAVENNINLIGRNGKTYVTGKAEVITSGKGLYDMVLNVKSGERVVWSKDITLASELAEFTINEALEMSPSEYLYMTVDFVYNGDKLVDTVEKDITDGYAHVAGRIIEVDTVNNTAMYVIEQAENFEGKKITGNDDTVIIQVDLGNTDIEKTLGMLTEAKLELTEKGYKVISYKLWPQNEIYTLSSELYKEDSYTAEAMEFYRSAASSKTDEYELDDAVIYVNGTEIKATKYLTLAEAKAAAIEKYVEGSATTEVKLVNTPAAGSKTVDGKIDIIMLSVYASAVVDDTIIDDEEAIIYIDYYNGDIIKSSKIVIDLEAVADGEADYSIVDTEGNEVALEELAMNDVITIYADFEDADILDKPAAIDMVVSKNVVDGKVMNEDEDNGEYKVNDTMYGFANGFESLKVGDDYILYLDRFGKIVKYEKNASAIKYGIINQIWTNTDGDEVIRLLDSNGEIVTYTFNKSEEYEIWQENFNYNYARERFADVYENVIVTYKLSSSGKIHSIASVGWSFNVTSGEFSERNTKVGSAKMSDRTKIVDMSNVVGEVEAWANKSLSGKVGARPLEYFLDGEVYTVVYGGEKFSDGTYPFVIVLAGAAKIVPTAAFAVVKATGSAVNDADGIDYESITVLEGNEEKVLYCASEFGVSKGDVIVYSYNMGGLVDAVYTLFDADDVDSLEDVLAWNSKYATKGAYYDSALYFDYAEVDAPVSWKDLTRDESYARVGYGVLAENTNNGILTIGKLVKDGENYKTTYVEDIDLATNARVYVYDENKKLSERLSTGVLSELVPAKISSKFYEEGEYYNWTEGGVACVNTVFFKTVDDEITDIVFIKPAQTKDYTAYSGTGVVDSVSIDGQYADIYFSIAYGELSATELLCTKAAEYTVIDTEGNSLSFSDIQKGDVLTVEEKLITVSRKTVKGIVTDEVNGEYKINDTMYGVVDEGIKLSDGEYYIFYLDKLDRIVKAEKTTFNTNYGIINQIWTNTNGEEVIRLLNSNGEIVKYEFSKSEDYVEWDEKFQIYADGDFEDVYKNVIVSYKLNADNKIHSIASVGDSFDVVTDEFKERYAKVGSAKMSDRTKIVDMSNVVGEMEFWANKSLKGKVGACPLEYFIDGEQYEIVYGGEKFADGTYPFVIVLAGAAKIVPTAAFAVVKSTGSAVNEADYIVYDTITVLEGDEEKVLYCDKDFEVKRGDVIVYEFDSEGLVSEVYVLFSASAAADMATIAGYSNYVTDETVNRAAYESALYIDYKNIDAPASWKDLTRDENYARVGYGVLAEKLSGSLIIGKLDKYNYGYITTYAEELELAMDVNVYVYDQNKIAAERLVAGTLASLAPTRIGRNFYESGEYYNWTEGGAMFVNTVFFKTVDDEITDIIMIIPYED